MSVENWIELACLLFIADFAMLSISHKGIAYRLSQLLIVIHAIEVQLWHTLLAGYDYFRSGIRERISDVRKEIAA